MDIAVAVSVQAAVVVEDLVLVEYFLWSDETRGSMRSIGPCRCNDRCPPTRASLTLSLTPSTPLLWIALHSVLSTISMSSQMHNRYVIKSARGRTLSTYSPCAPPSYTYPHGNRVTKKGIKRHQDDLHLFVERDAECRDEPRFAGYQELVVDYGQLEG